VYLRLRVSDNGCGMTDETQARLFEPFFTTKEPGRGTGLGLATVYSTARDHGGWVACDSRLGEGTSFSVYLPARKPPTGADARHTEPPPSVRPRPAGASGGAEVVLVVDEDPLARKAIARALRDVGYLVEEAASAATVVERIERGVYGKADQVDLILLDRAIDEAGGNAVGEHLVAIATGSGKVWPAIVVVDDRDAPGGDTRPRLRKPVARRELLAAVRRELDGRARSASVDGPGTSW
jgi:two-component system cell cycle sensor histidine kinase/response regulator CckA